MKSSFRLILDLTFLSIENTYNKTQMQKNLNPNLQALSSKLLYSNYLANIRNAEQYNAHKQILASLHCGLKIYPWKQLQIFSLLVHSRYAVYHKNLKRSYHEYLKICIDYVENIQICWFILAKSSKEGLVKNKLSYTSLVS